MSMEINTKTQITKTPCKHCPWKKSSKAGGKNIPNFNVDMMRDLANTAPPKGSHDTDFRPIFACHDSKEGEEYGCAGYAARDGLDNLSLRFLVSAKDINLSEIITNAEKHELYDNFHDMLDEYEKAAEPIKQFDHIQAMLNHANNKNYCALTRYIERYAPQFEPITIATSLRAIDLSEEFVAQFHSRLRPLLKVIEQEQNHFDLKTVFHLETLKNLMNGHTYEHWFWPYI